MQTGEEDAIIVLKDDKLKAHFENCSFIELDYHEKPLLRYCRGKELVFDSENEAKQAIKFLNEKNFVYDGATLSPKYDSSTKTYTLVCVILVNSKAHKQWFRVHLGGVLTQALAKLEKRKEEINLLVECAPPGTFTHIEETLAHFRSRLNTFITENEIAALLKEL